MKKLLMIPAALLMSTAFAAPKLSAQSIIVNPVQPDLSVQVRVDRDNSGKGNPIYTTGNNIQITTTVNRDAYVYLFNVDAKGEVTQILPNRLGGDNFLKANTPKVFPEPGSGFTFDIGADQGLNKVLALASLTPLNLDQLSTFKSSQDQFATVSARGQERLAQALSIVVNPIPQNSWVTDTVFFTVVGQNPVTTGSLFVGTNVQGATVTLGNQTLGSANTTYSGLRPGTYALRVRASGYPDYTTNVTIRQNSTTNVNVEFNQVVPMPSNYSVTIRSNVNGARVFVDGNEVGTVRNGALTVNVSRGAHEIVFINPGYRTFINTYNISSNGQITINPVR